jgi:hypothetical protein
MSDTLENDKITLFDVNAAQANTYAQLVVLSATVANLTKRVDSIENRHKLQHQISKALEVKFMRLKRDHVDTREKLMQGKKAHEDEMEELRKGRKSDVGHLATELEKLKQTLEASIERISHWSKEGAEK